MNTESYVTHLGRTYAVNSLGQVFARVEIKNPDVGNKRAKWVRTTSIRICRVVVWLARNEVAA
jgi:hypothetical protein